MSFVGSMFGGGGKGANYTAGQAPILSPVNLNQTGAAYNQAQSGLQQQQAFVNALQAQNGLANQSGVFNQLQGVANGTGPNPALAMLNQQTGNNVNQQAALMAGQRGAGSNVGLMARQIGQQGAGIQQNAIGQGAGLQAQQQFGALGQMGQIAGEQVGNLSSSLMGQNQATQAEQAQLLNAIDAINRNKVGMQSNMNQANSNIQSGIAGTQGQIIGGAMNGIGPAGKLIGSMFAGGGTVPGYAPGGQVFEPSSFAGRFLAGFQDPSLNQGQMPVQNGFNPTQSMPSNLSQGMANGMQSIAQGIYNVGNGLFSTHNENNDLIPGLSQGGNVKNMRPGGDVPGQAKVSGDSYANDTVSAKLSPGEIVIPRSIAEHPNAPALAAQFVANELAKKKPLMQGNLKAGFNDGGTSGQSVFGDAYDNARPAMDEPMEAPASPQTGPTIASTPVNQGPMSPDYVKNLSDNMNKQLADNDALGKQAQKSQASQVSAIDPLIHDLRRQGNLDQIHTQNLIEDHQKLMNDYAAGHIDPGRVINNMSTGSKIGTAIGLIIGGMGSGITHQPNLAYEMLNNEINNDIKAQTDEMGKKQNLMTANMQQFRNVQDAQQATRANKLGIIDLEMKKAAMQSGSQEAMLRYQLAHDQMQGEIYKTLIPLQWKQDAYKQASGGGDANSIDPASLVGQIVDPAHQKDVTDAIGVAQHISNNIPEVTRLFDEEAKEVRPYSAGGIGKGLKATYYGALPGTESGAGKQLTALQTPLVKSEIGRNSEFTDKVLRAARPAFGDSDERIEEKRRNYINLWKDLHQQAATTAKGLSNGILDLNKFSSTNPVLNTVSKIPNGQAMLQWSMKHPNQQEAEIFLKKIGVK